MALNQNRPRAERMLDPDILPWEKQQGETDLAYGQFLRYRDMERRSVREAGPNSNNLSVQWMWGLRCLEWDRFVHRQDAEALVRYRVQMNERQRATSRFAQQKLIQWLTDLDPSKLTPNEAARWFEVAVRVEREAAGVGLAVAATPPPEVPDPFAGQTLAEVLGMPDRADDAIVIAAAEEIFAQLEGQDVRDFQPSQQDDPYE